jgi:threonine/homoserine/homoserine lactone efflux protein
MSTLLKVYSVGFEAVRWVGVGYLLYLGVRQFRAVNDREPEENPKARGRRRWIFQGLFLALANPKTLLFFAAFLPQFVSPSYSPGFQMVVLSLTFTAIAFLLDMSYALLAAVLRTAIADAKSRTWFARLSGSLLIGAGVGLAMARRN